MPDRERWSTAKRHTLFWGGVAVLVLVAVLAGSWKGQHSGGGVDAAALTDEALSLLKKDPGAWERDTQTVVRSAAVALAAQGPQTASGCYVLGVQYERESNFPEAEELFRKALALDPKWAEPYAALGSLLGRQTVGRAREARSMLNAAIQLEPKWSRPHNLLAIVLRDEGRLAEAEKEAQEALRLNPEDIAAHNNYANLLVQLKRYDEAAQHYQVAVTANPNHAKPYYNLACLYSLMGKPELAIENLSAALERAPALRNQASGDHDFKPLRELPEFQKLVFGEVLSE